MSKKIWKSAEWGTKKPEFRFIPEDQIKEIDEVKSWITCVKIRGKSSTFKWWNLDYV